MTTYIIRLAKQIDSRSIKEIELAAASRFKGLKLIDHLLDHHFDQDLLRILISDKQVWVACEVTGQRQADTSEPGSEASAMGIEGEDRDHRRYNVQRRKIRRKPEVLDPPVGFAIATILGPLAYLEELDVLPAHGRKGLGRKLIEAVVHWAKQKNYPHITLSTFSDIAWNRPFYERLGFKIMTENELESELKHIRTLEMKLGLPVEQRVFMRRYFADSAT
jgi:GNAT superfamily N-acetyltransferase